MKRMGTLLALCLFLAAACDELPRATVVEGPPGVEGNGGVEEEAGEETETPPPLAPGVTGTTIVAEGQLVALHPPLPLGFQTSGRLLTLEVTPGDLVEEGDLVATLDDSELQLAVTRAEQQVAAAENGVAQAQLALDELLEWTADAPAVALAEANVAAAEATYAFAQQQDASASNSLTSARINLERAQRAVEAAQEAYDIAFDPGREWELYMTELSCLPGQGGSVPCTGPPYRARMEAERAGAERAVESAAENLILARANYALAVSSLNENSAASAYAALLNAQQALRQTETGPRAQEIEAARLRLEQADLSLQQALFTLDQAKQAIENRRLATPWSGTVLTVEVAPGAMVVAGAPVITVADTSLPQFHTTNLSERDIGAILPGLPVQVSLKTFPGQELSGSVARIVPQASGRVGDAATFTVVIDLDESVLRLLAGMTGRVEITAGNGGS